MVEEHASGFTRRVSIDGDAACGDLVCRSIPAGASARLLAIDTEGGSFHAVQIPRMYTGLAGDTVSSSPSESGIVDPRAARGHRRTSEERRSAS